jgi:hypothetical protein
MNWNVYGSELSWPNLSHYLEGFSKATEHLG